MFREEKKKPPGLVFLYLQPHQAGRAQRGVYEAKAPWKQIVGPPQLRGARSLLKTWSWHPGSCNLNRWQQQPLLSQMGRSSALLPLYL